MIKKFTIMFMQRKFKINIIAIEIYNMLIKVKELHRFTMFIPKYRMLKLKINKDLFKLKTFKDTNH
jgi:hypothetical protein